MHGIHSRPPPLAACATLVHVSHVAENRCGCGADCTAHALGARLETAGFSAERGRLPSARAPGGRKRRREAGLVQHDVACVLHIGSFD